MTPRTPSWLRPHAGRVNTLVGRDATGKAIYRKVSTAVTFTPVTETREIELPGGKKKVRMAMGRLKSEKRAMRRELHEKVQKLTGRGMRWKSARRWLKANLTSTGELR